MQIGLTAKVVKSIWSKLYSRWVQMAEGRAEFLAARRSSPFANMLAIFSAFCAEIFHRKNIHAATK
jgi:hypothetical protein